jgi:hypothetical protein
MRDDAVDLDAELCTNVEGIFSIMLSHKLERQRIDEIEAKVSQLPY